MLSSHSILVISCVKLRWNNPDLSYSSNMKETPDNGSKAKRLSATTEVSNAAFEYMYIYILLIRETKSDPKQVP